MTHIAVFGAGRMGTALATAFLSRGHRVAVWNRTHSRCAPLASLGARIAGSPAEAVEGAALVIGNVIDYAATDEVVRGEGVARALRDAVLLQLASGTPRQARELAAWAAEHEVRYLDGVIWSTPELVGQPACTIAVAGPGELLAQHEATLTALGGAPRHVGASIGHANALDQGLQATLWGATLGVLQAAAICDAEGFALDVFAPAQDELFPMTQELLRGLLERIRERRFEADASTAATIASTEAGFGALRAISEEHGLDAGLPETLQRLSERARGRGHAQSDVSALYVAMAREP